MLDDYFRAPKKMVLEYVSRMTMYGYFNHSPHAKSIMPLVLDCVSSHKRFEHLKNDQKLF